MLQWADDFKGYGTNAGLLTSGIYAELGAQAGLANSPDGSGVVFVQNGVTAFEGQALRKVLLSPQTTVGIAARFWIVSLPSSPDMSVGLSSWHDINNFNQVALWVTTTGAIVARRNSGSAISGTELGTTAGPVLVAGSYQHVESKCVLGTGTSGSLEVRVDGITVLNLTGIDTVGGALPTCAQISVNKDNSSIGTGVQWFMKDLVIWDGSGSLNNNFMGSVSVFSIVPSADNTLTWTPVGAANGFSILDNSPPQDGVQYISAAATGLGPSVFAGTDLPEDVTSVRGLVAVARARKSDGGDGNIQVSLDSGGNIWNGANRPVTPVNTYWYDVNETDPATGNPWAPASLNNALLRIERTL